MGQHTSRKVTAGQSTTRGGPARERKGEKRGGKKEISEEIKHRT